MNISLFTATFNRGRTLARLYRSILNQTDNDFLWEIIDDGSTDDTAQVVAGFIAEGKLRIRYLFVEHSGKHGAFNKYLDSTRSDITVEIDSDDELLPDAVRTIRIDWSTSDQKNEDLFSVFYGCVYQNGVYVGKPFRMNSLATSFKRFNFSKKYRSEKLRTFRTRYLQRARFPISFGPSKECYIPESVLFLRASQNNLSRFEKTPLRIYHQDTVSLMRNNKGWRWNVSGMAYGLKETLNLAGTYLIIKRPMFFLSCVYNYSRFMQMQDIHFFDQIKVLSNVYLRLAVMCIYPLSKLRVIIDGLR